MGYLLFITLIKPKTLNSSYQTLSFINNHLQVVLVAEIDDEKPQPSLKDVAIPSGHNLTSPTFRALLPMVFVLHFLLRTAPESITHFLIITTYRS